jgi:uncharacterized membrane protein
LAQVVSNIIGKIHSDNYIGDFTIDDGVLIITTLDNNIIFNMINIINITVLLNEFDYERFVDKEINITDLHTFAKVRAFTEKDVRLKDINDFKHYCVEKEI